MGKITILWSRLMYGLLFLALFSVPGFQGLGFEHNMIEHEHDNTPHCHGDHSMHNDHMAIMALVAPEDITHTANQSGKWGDASTWGGELPTSGARVHIPEGVEVEYNLPSSARLKTVRIDGALTFTVSHTTRLSAETIVVMNSGRLSIGSQSKRLPGNVSARIVFLNPGPIDPVEDPTKIGRGLISIGSVEMVGARKTPYLPLAEAPSAGATELLLSAVPRGWRVGETLIIPGTKFNGAWVWDGPDRPLVYAGTEDEVRMIAGISGRRVTLDRPLDYAHVPSAPYGTTNAKAYAVHFSRNITLSSEQEELTPTQQRGHTMFMSHDTYIENVGFNGLGRTDKSIPVDDAGENLDGTVGTASNPRGRYPVHFHKVGSVDRMCKPGVLRGSAIWTSPGWGAVAHSSYALFEDTVSFDVFGSHFVTENGDELGAFRRLFAIKSQGRRDGHVKDGTGNHDLGHRGHGVWFQGRNMLAEDIKVAGVSSAGVIYFHRSHIFMPYLPLNTLMYPANLSKLAPGGAFIDHVAIRRSINLEVFASRVGLWVIKNDPVPNVSDLRSFFENLDFWQVEHGLELEYTAHYTLEDVTIICSGRDSWRDRGIRIGSRVRDLVINTSYIRDCGKGYTFSSEFDGQPDYVDVTVIDPEFENIIDEGGEFGYNPLLEVISASDIADLPLSFEASNGQPYQLPSALSGWDSGSYFFVGLKTDSLGVQTTESKWNGDLIYGHLSNVGHFEEFEDSNGNGVVEPGETRKFLEFIDYYSDRLDPRKLYKERYHVELSEGWQAALGPALKPPGGSITSLPNTREDHYQVCSSALLRVPAPGVLENDTGSSLEVDLTTIEALEGFHCFQMERFDSSLKLATAIR